jgi:hypothetical protein
LDTQWFSRGGTGYNRETERGPAAGELNYMRGGNKREKKKREEVGTDARLFDP